MVLLKVKENTKQAKLMLEYLKSLPYVEVIEPENIPNRTTLRAMKDAEEGKVTKAKNVNDLIAKLNQ